MMILQFYVSQNVRDEVVGLFAATGTPMWQYRSDKMQSPRSNRQRFSILDFRLIYNIMISLSSLHLYYHLFTISRNCLDSIDASKDHTFRVEDRTHSIRIYHNFQVGCLSGPLLVALYSE